MNFLNKLKRNRTLNLIFKIKQIKANIEQIVSILENIPKPPEDFSKSNIINPRGITDSLIIELKSLRKKLDFNKKLLSFSVSLNEINSIPKEKIAIIFSKSVKLGSAIDKNDDISSGNPFNLFFQKNKNIQEPKNFELLEMDHERIERLLQDFEWKYLDTTLFILLDNYIFKTQEIERYLIIQNQILYQNQSSINKKNGKLSEMSGVEYRQTRLIPRSIPRTIERFIDELNLTAEDRYLKEFKLSRQQIWIAFRSLVGFIIFPILITQGIKNTIIEPVVSYTWNIYNKEIFLNHQQEQKALRELKAFEDQVYFEQLVRFSDNSNSLLGNDHQFSADYLTPYNDTMNEPRVDPAFSVSNQGDTVPSFKKQRIEPKMIAIAKKYNSENIDIISNILGDFVSLGTFVSLVLIFQREVSIIKAFFSEVLYSLSDTTKSFFIILLTDLLVGFHSPKGWEILIESSLDHFAFPQNGEFVFLCVATFPVLLDTAFKYWIFRYLNRLSPSTVVTYHNMIE